MIKKYSHLLLGGVLLLGACSQASEEPDAPAAGSSGAETVPVEFAITRAAADDFAAAGIEKFSIFVYKTERKTSQLYAEQEVSVDGGNFSIELPLGENFKAFAIANAVSVTGKESFETVAVTIDPAADSEIWLSAASAFASDKSVATVNLTLQRAVAKVEFAPAETSEELSAAGFDELSLTFTNTARTMLIDGSKVENESLTLTTDAAHGFATSFYTFDTRANGEASMLTIDYLKAGQKVNSSAGALDTGVTYQSNYLYKMTVPVLNNSFVETPWNRGTRSLGFENPYVKVVATPLN